MKRGHGSHLSPDEVADLHRRILAGEKTPRLAREFNIAERTVDVHRAKIRGTHRRGQKEVAVAATDTAHLNVNRICWVENCGAVITPSAKFCAAHKYQKPDVSSETFVRMTARRA